MSLRSFPIKGDPARLALLAGGAGTTVSAFCEAVRDGKLPAQIATAITNKGKAGVRAVAEKWKIPCPVIPYRKENPEAADRLLRDTLKTYHPDLILLAGFLKKIGPLTLSHFENRILNSHPALIPEFSGQGMYGLRVHTAVITDKRRETGVTIHLVSEGYDEGRILAQEKLSVFPEDTPLNLEKRVKRLEKKLYIQTVKKILMGELSLK